MSGKERLEWKGAIRMHIMLRKFLLKLHKPNAYFENKAFLASMKEMNRSVNALSKLASEGHLPKFKVKSQ